MFSERTREVFFSTKALPHSKTVPTPKAGPYDEITKIFWGALSLFLFLALISFSPTDSSWSTWSDKAQFSNWLGRAGSFISDLLYQLLGLGAFGLMLLFLIKSFKSNPSENGTLSRSKQAASFLGLSICFCVLLESLLPVTWMPWQIKHPGGVAGYLFKKMFSYLGGQVGALLLSISGTFVFLVLLFKLRPLSATLHFFELGLGKMAFWIFELKNSIFRPKAISAVPFLAPLPTIAPPPLNQPSIPPIEEAWSPPEIKKQKKPDSFAQKISGAKKGEFVLPSSNLLSTRIDSKAKAVDKNWYLEKGNILVQKLKDFGVNGEIAHISPGPVITVYEFKPASGVKIKEIANLSDDLTLALSVLSVRIVAPIPGKPVVGIEIPSPNREVVYFKEVVEETAFYSPELRVPLAMGRLPSGEPALADLASMPHLLVAGSTGTGKSVFINTLICSLLYRHTPDRLKLILVDPKMVELTGYEGIPHLLLPVVVDSKKAVLALRWAVDEMERRYALLHSLGVRHIESYNAKVAEEKESSEKPLPYIVVVIDEYADLMAVVPKDVELSITRLAQKARASGIHLVLATQRPSTDVVTGTIKANFPSRISFRVASSVDSKTILDRTGADRLLGNGDMLFHSAGFLSLKRMQGAFIHDQDLEQVVEHWKAQGEPEYDERILAEKEAEPVENDTIEDKQLYDSAVHLVSEKGEASISLLQRHLRIGYNRAASLMEELEKQGVVGESTSPAKRRTVLVQGH